MNQGYARRWYVYKYGKGSNLEDLKFKNLRDVQDFVHSDLPGAKIHRRAIETGKRQTEASVEYHERKLLKKKKKEDRVGGEKRSRDSTSTPTKRYRKSTL